MRVPTLYLDTSDLGGYFDDEWKQPKSFGIRWQTASGDS
jgi:hypothetical protein